MGVMTRVTEMMMSRPGLGNGSRDEGIDKMAEGRIGRLHTYLIAIPLILSLLFTASGCWSRKELEDMAIVSGIGIDLMPDSDMIALTFEVILPAVMRSIASGGSGGGGAAGKDDIKASLIITNTGKTYFDAERSFRCQTTKRLFLSHT